MNSTKPFQEQGNFTQMHNILFDVVQRHISTSAWSVLSVIIRESKGHQRRSCEVAYSRISENTGIRSDTTIAKVLDELCREDIFGTALVVRKGNAGKTAHYALNPHFEVKTTPKNGRVKQPHDSKKWRGTSPKNEAEPLQKMETSKERKEIPPPSGGGVKSDESEKKAAPPPPQLPDSISSFQTEKPQTFEALCSTFGVYPNDPEPYDVQLLETQVIPVLLSESDEDETLAATIRDAYELGVTWTLKDPPRLSNFKSTWLRQKQRLEARRKAMVSSATPEIASWRQKLNATRR